jgi:uncharacterized protein YeaO (DUF488 family)
MKERGDYSVIKVKRVYDEAEPSDGNRILIDRIWPRGVKKNNLALDGWLKEVAPSDRLRKWFDHDPRKWQEFRRRYFAELRAKAETWTPILERACKADVTLLYGARDSNHNQAVALRDFLIGKTNKTMVRMGSRPHTKQDGFQ